MGHTETIVGRNNKKKIFVDNEALAQLQLLELVKSENGKLVYEDKDEEIIRETIAK